jgi:serine/threonine protein kinase
MLVEDRFEQPLGNPTLLLPGEVNGEIAEASNAAAPNVTTSVPAVEAAIALDADAVSGGAGSGDGVSIATIIENIPADGTLTQEPSTENGGDAIIKAKIEGVLDSGKLSSSMDSDASTCAPTAHVGTPATCHQCGSEALELFVDHTDLNRYCERCWVEYYGQHPSRCESQPLVSVEVMEIWPEDRLVQQWEEMPIAGWPPVQMQQLYGASEAEGEIWSSVAVRVRRDIVGPHAREQSNVDRPYTDELLARRYRCRSVVGEGHFTKAFLADDTKEGISVCVKRHRGLSVEALADLMVIGRRLHEVDTSAVLFPRLIDAFFDIVGYTVESLLEGSNCLALAAANPDHFLDLGNLRSVAADALKGLAALADAGVVHNDIKPDNLIWTEVHAPSNDAAVPGIKPQVRIVDFGCARLEEPGRNWSLAEGGAGHLGKWSPEMTLRLPITHKGDVWGLAVSLCELHCGRCVWRDEADTAEVVLAQALGLSNQRDGLPTSMLKRSPLDIRQLYSPQPKHFPVRRNILGYFEALQPVLWGLDQVLGENWREVGKGEFGDFLQTALVVDPVYRPSAAELLESCSFVASTHSELGTLPASDLVAEPDTELM